MTAQNPPSLTSIQSNYSKTPAKHDTMTVIFAWHETCPSLGEGNEKTFKPFLKRKKKIGGHHEFSQT
jgi:hypothetical protein